MYIMDALRYPFNSKDWSSKYLMLFVISIIPILNFFVLSGYMYRVIRELASGNMELPEMDFGQDISRGFFILIVALAYMVPFFIVMGILMGVFQNSGILFSLVSLLSSVASILIGLLLQVALLRYAFTEDTSVLTDFSGNLTILRDNVSALITYILNAFILSFVASFLVGIGMVLCIIPGIIAAITVMFANAYLLARFASDAGITERKSKAKNFG